jgi:hypothetical protein
MVDKYIGVDGNGNESEVPFKQASAGAADSGKGVALNPAGKIDSTMLANFDVTSIATSENLVAPALVNIWNSTGPKARYADASAANLSKIANGYVIDSATSPAAVSVYTDRGAIIPGYTGLTPGAQYFLSGTVPGGITVTPVTASGQALQKIGIALSATELEFSPEPAIIRA